MLLRSMHIIQQTTSVQDENQNTIQQEKQALMPLPKAYHVASEFEKKKILSAHQSYSI
jgi:hypothetical protein